MSKQDYDNREGNMPSCANCANVRYESPAIDSPYGEAWCVKGVCDLIYGPQLAEPWECIEWTPEPPKQ